MDALVELAPANKRGLTLRSPLLVASGMLGYGELALNNDQWQPFGALVTAPISFKPWAGRRPPRLAEFAGGIVLAHGNQNPGVRRVIKNYAGLWHNLPLPVIAHIPAHQPGDAREVAHLLAGVEGIAGIEIGIPDDMDAQSTQALIRTLRNDHDWPILVKLPYFGVAAYARACAEAGADTLVIGQPPHGSYPVGRRLVNGRLYSTSLLPLALRALVEARDAAPDLPRVACGGIHTIRDVRHCLAAGASAVALDSLLLVEPFAAHDLAAQL